MKTINICLITEDIEYGLALSRSLQFHSKFFSIQLDDKWQKTNEVSRESIEFDILLTDDMKVSTDRTVFLSEEPKHVMVDPPSRTFVIYKYQHVSKISSLLRLAHSVYSKSEMLSDETEQASIISVSASSGGTGCTSIALGICQELIRFRGKKVLYISLEEFESTASYFPSCNSEAINISRYLYSILNDTSAASWAAEGYMVKDEYGISAFMPAKGRNPLRELSRSEFVKFINHVTKDKIYTDLILDCGNGLDASIATAFELSSSVCFISGKNPDLNRREAYLRTAVHRAAGDGVLNMTEVYNFYDEPEQDALESSEEIRKETLFIEEDVTGLTALNGHRLISLDKTFGQGIRQIVQRITGLEG